MSTPRLSIGSWAFSFGPFESEPWPLSRVLRFAADAGYDGVELNGFRPHAHPDDYETPERCRELMDEVQGLGLGVSGYAPDFTALPPAEVETEDYLAALRKCLAFCNRCGIGTLRVDTVSPPVGMPRDAYEERFARLVRTWQAAAEEAARTGVLMVWEFEPGFWLSKPSEVKRLAESVGHENFKLLFDTSHAYMGAVVGARHTGRKETLPGGVVEYAAALGDLVGHLHLIDSDGTLHDDETSTHAPFGSGRVDFKQVLSAMKPVIAGLPWWCVDLCFWAEAEAAGTEGAAFVRDLMEEVLG